MEGRRWSERGSWLGAGLPAAAWPPVGYSLGECPGASLLAMRRRAKALRGELGRPARRSLHLGRRDLAPTLDLTPAALSLLARQPLWPGHARRNSLFSRLGSFRHETSKAL